LMVKLRTAFSAMANFRFQRGRPLLARPIAFDVRAYWALHSIPARPSEQRLIEARR
jgi:hypothetical protein